MKRYLAIVMMCVVLISSLTSVGAFAQELSEQNGYAIEFNEEATAYTTVICNDTHYVPMRMIFEKMGAKVFYRSSDRQVLVLSRDGDVIRHIISDNVIIVNDEQKIMTNPSILVNEETYIPLDMVSVAFCPDGVYCEDEKLNLHKQLFESDSHRLVKDILDFSKDGGFYPERFQRYIKLHAKTPSYSVQEVIFRVNLGLDYPFYENMDVVENPYDTFVLVNKYHKLPSGFAHEKLVGMGREYTANDGKQYWLAPEAYEKYVQMSDKAKQEGINMRVISAYRTEDYQRGLYNNKVRTTGKINADNYSARPGSSEHQTGLAVDISSTRGTFEYTPEFKWMQKHAHEYGFILRYPRGKEWITGYSYEPWHYRYVGEDAARIIHEEGITYEEYYAKYISVNEFR